MGLAAGGPGLVLDARPLPRHGRTAPAALHPCPHQKPRSPMPANHPPASRAGRHPPPPPCGPPPPIEGQAASPNLLTPHRPILPAAATASSGPPAIWAATNRQRANEKFGPPPPPTGAMRSDRRCHRGPYDPIKRTKRWAPDRTMEWSPQGVEAPGPLQCANKLVRPTRGSDPTAHKSHTLNSQGHAPHVVTSSSISVHMNTGAFLDRD